MGESHRELVVDPNVSCCKLFIDASSLVKLNMWTTVGPTLFEIGPICEMDSISLMQESVTAAAEWTNNNDMNINSEKSKEMIISYARGNIGITRCRISILL